LAANSPVIAGLLSSYLARINGGTLIQEIPEKKFLLRIELYNTDLIKEIARKGPKCLA